MYKIWSLKSTKSCWDKLKIQTNEDNWCVQVSTHSILSLLATLIYKFNPTPVRNFRCFLLQLTSRSQNSCKNTRPKIVQTALKRENKSGFLTLSDLTIYYTILVTIINIMWYWYKDTQINGTEFRNSPHTRIQSPVLFDRVTKEIQQRKASLEWCSTTEWPYVKYKLSSKFVEHRRAPPYYWTTPVTLVDWVPDQDVWSDHVTQGDYPDSSSKSKSGGWKWNPFY